MPFVPVQSNTTTHTCDKCDTCPLLTLFQLCSPVPTLFQRHSLPQLQNNLRHLLSITTTPSPSAVGEAVRIDLASLFSSCYNLVPDHRPPNMNGTTEPVNAASAATQTTEPVKMNGTSTTTTTTAATPGAGLFGDDLISPDVAKALPEGYKIRALQQSDFKAGFLDCLRVLTTVGDITEAQFAERFEWLSKQDGGYYILVIEDGGRVVGTGALIVERKLYVAPHFPKTLHPYGSTAPTTGSVMHKSAALPVRTSKT